MKFIDLTGQKFNRLTVLERVENDKNGCVRWLCRCDCGNEVAVSASNLKNGHTQSCGCLNHENLINRNTKHSMSSTKIYKTWKGIKKRCYNPNCAGFDNYGGRGITMFAAWINDFQAFYGYVSQLEHFNEDGYSLDRIDNDVAVIPDSVRQPLRLVLRLLYAVADGMQTVPHRRGNVRSVVCGPADDAGQPVQLSAHPFQVAFREMEHHVWLQKPDHAADALAVALTHANSMNMKRMFKIQ